MDENPQSKEVAAFFDLDKTILAGATMLILSPTLRKNGLLNRRSLVRAAYGAIIFELLGANEKRMEKMRVIALELTKGWNRDHVQSIVDEVLLTEVVPKIYDEAAEQIREHLSHGKRVVIVSASPLEIVEPIAHHLGVQDVIATRAKLDGAGNYSGKLEVYAAGPNKPELVKQFAEAHRIDLDVSYAYSDSFTDVPFLECVGHPVAVNPDRDLTRHAKANGWEIRRFAHPVSIKDRSPVSALHNPWIQVAGIGLAVGMGMAIARRFVKT